MQFESLSHRYTFNISEVPSRWLPLLHLYDPDLPLFPIFYFHVLSKAESVRERPRDSGRAYGFVEKINSADKGIDVTLVINKDLNDPDQAEVFLDLVVNEVRERFGVQDPVRQSDVSTAFKEPLTQRNDVLKELWLRVVSNAYGDMLPFGRLWDETLGFTRFVASFNSDGGRKGELIQTHYFASRFGASIQSANDIPQVDFFLLPTVAELTNPDDPIAGFPNYAALAEVATLFQKAFCSTVDVGGLTLSKFNNPRGGRFNTEGLQALFNSAEIPHKLRPVATECFNAFVKGPPRTIIFLMMLADLRSRRLEPGKLTPEQCGSIYDGLGRSYQSPKVIQIYAQQSFGNKSAMPVDTWIDTFFKWPLAVYPMHRPAEGLYTYIFSHADNLGKVERLLWVTAQARKVHSSACNDAIWCTKWSSSREPRGANPFACNICLDSIRRCCPAYDRIRSDLVCFNGAVDPSATFAIETSAGNNESSNQSFIKCTGKSIYNDILDDFSPADAPTGFAPFPQPGHDGSALTVDRFVAIY
jgi:hypothetical protein